MTDYIGIIKDDTTNVLSIFFAIIDSLITDG